MVNGVWLQSGGGVNGLVMAYEFGFALKLKDEDHEAFQIFFLKIFESLV
jgi:hypothetical protein